MKRDADYRQKVKEISVGLNVPALVVDAALEKMIDKQPERQEEIVQTLLDFLHIVTQF